MKEIYRLKISRDDNPSSPREYSNIGTMYCWHRRYTLGDEQPKADPPEVLVSLVTEITPVGEHFEQELEDWFDTEWTNRKISDLEGKAYDEARDALYREKRQKIQDAFDEHYVMLPLFLYDHSGITMSTGAFSCRWDSGQVGFICCSKKKAKEELGYPEFKVEGWTAAMTERLETMLKNEVEVYDQYLTGDVYGFELQKLVYEFEQPDEEVDVEDDDLPWDDGDSCWGFFGDDPDENGMIDHIGKGRLEAAKEAYHNIDEWVACPPEEKAPVEPEASPA